MKNILFSAKILLLLLSVAVSIKAVSADDSGDMRGPLVYKSPQTSTPGRLDGFPPPLRDTLKTATEVRFYQRSKDYNWQLLPFAILSERSHPHMFHLIKTTPCHHGPGYSRIAMCKAAFIKHGKVMLEVGYYANIGWLTEPQQQNGLVPDELREWLYSLTMIPKEMGPA